MQQDLQDRLSHEEDAHTALTSQKKKLEQEMQQQKKEIEDLELSIQKVWTIFTSSFKTINNLKVQMI